MITQLRARIPDVHATVEDIVAECDKVAVRWTFRGTYQGEVRPGFPNPGERITITSLSMYRSDGVLIGWTWRKTHGTSRRWTRSPVQTWRFTSY